VTVSGPSTPHHPRDRPPSLEAILLAYLKASWEQSEDDLFQDLARRLFRWQFERNHPYQRFCLGRGVTPQNLESWTDIPAVPTDVFKAIDLVDGPLEAVQRTFLTSGTTRGQTRGRHHFPTLSLYAAAALSTFDHFCLPDGMRLPLFALLPSEQELPESSLSHMAALVMEQLGASESRFFWKGNQLDISSLNEALKALCTRSQPVMLLGTAFAFVHWFDETPAGALSLPPGSRVMETGGLKGRAREISRDALYAQIQSRLGLPKEAIISEYGMTELSSQLYDGAFRATHLGQSVQPGLQGPPWLRFRVMDPIRLEPVPDGEIGLIQLFDLANLHSVSAIQTADLGVIQEGRLELLGRAPDAEARGCSLTAEELLKMSPGARDEGP